MTWTLERLGPHSQKFGTIELTKSKNFSIGRNSDCDFQLSDKCISRRSVVFSLIDDQWQIEGKAVYVCDDLIENVVKAKDGRIPLRANDIVWLNQAPTKVGGKSLINESVFAYRLTYSGVNVPPADLITKEPAADNGLPKKCLNSGTETGENTSVSLLELSPANEQSPVNVELYQNAADLSIGESVVKEIVLLPESTNDRVIHQPEIEREADDLCQNALDCGAVPAGSAACDDVEKSSAVGHDIATRLTVEEKVACEPTLRSLAEISSELKEVKAFRMKYECITLSSDEEEPTSMYELISDSELADKIIASPCKSVENASPVLTPPAVAGAHIPVRLTNSANATQSADRDRVLVSLPSSGASVINDNESFISVLISSTSALKSVVPEFLDSVPDNQSGAFDETDHDVDLLPMFISPLKANPTADFINDNSASTHNQQTLATNTASSVIQPAVPPGGFVPRQLTIVKEIKNICTVLPNAIRNVVGANSGCIQSDNAKCDKEAHCVNVMSLQIALTEVKEHIQNNHNLVSDVVDSIDAAGNTKVLPQFNLVVEPPSTIAASAEKSQVISQSADQSKDELIAKLGIPDTGAILQELRSQIEKQANQDNSREFESRTFPKAYCVSTYDRSSPLLRKLTSCGSNDGACPSPSMERLCASRALLEKQLIDLPSASDAGSDALERDDKDESLKTSDKKKNKKKRKKSKNKSRSKPDKKRSSSTSSRRSRAKSSHKSRKSSTSSSHTYTSDDTICEVLIDLRKSKFNELAHERSRTKIDGKRPRSRSKVKEHDRAKSSSRSPDYRRKRLSKSDRSHSSSRGGRSSSRSRARRYQRRSSSGSQERRRRSSDSGSNRKNRLITRACPMTIRSPRSDRNQVRSYSRSRSGTRDRRRNSVRSRSRSSISSRGSNRSRGHRGYSRGRGDSLSHRGYYRKLYGNSRPLIVSPDRDSGSDSSYIYPPVEQLSNPRLEHTRIVKSDMRSYTKTLSSTLERESNSKRRRRSSSGSQRDRAEKQSASRSHTPTMNDEKSHKKLTSSSHSKYNDRDGITLDQISKKEKIESEFPSILTLSATPQKETATTAVDPVPPEEQSASKRKREPKVVKPSLFIPTAWDTKPMFAADESDTEPDVVHSSEQRNKHSSSLRLMDKEGRKKENSVNLKQANKGSQRSRSRSPTTGGRRTPRSSCKWSRSPTSRNSLTPRSHRSLSSSGSTRRSVSSGVRQSRSRSKSRFNSNKGAHGGLCSNYDDVNGFFRSTGSSHRGGHFRGNARSRSPEASFQNRGRGRGNFFRGKRGYRHFNNNAHSSNHNESVVMYVTPGDVCIEDDWGPAPSLKKPAQPAVPGESAKGNNGSSMLASMMQVYGGNSPEPMDCGSN